MTAPRLRIFAYTVEGAGGFPFDMLRYDEAWPAFEREVGRLHDGHAAVTHRERERRRVELRSIKMPTDERWASFGWKVLREAGPDMSPHQVSS